MFTYSGGRTFSDGIEQQLQEERQAGTSPTPADVHKALGEIRGIDFGPNSVPDWGQKKTAEASGSN